MPETDEAAIALDEITDKIGDQVFGHTESEPVETIPETGDIEPAADAPPPSGPVTDPKATVKPAVQQTVQPVADEDAEAPKSWPKEMHAHWPTTPKEVRQYWKTREKQMLDGLEQYKGDATAHKEFREIINPYMPAFTAQNIDPKVVVKNLLGAHWRLTQGTVESRKAAYEQLGRDLQLVAADPNAPPPDPRYTALEQQLNQITSTLTAQQQAAYNDARDKSGKEVEAFASDTKAHPYFDDVADTIAMLLKADHKLSLQDAYDQAVWANAVTRQKELNRLQTEDASRKTENARLNALQKKKAASVNLNSRDSNKAPTEQVGSMDDTIRETFQKIQGRA